MKATKPVLERVPHREWESFHCEELHGPDYGTRWHFHPEYQLTLAIRSRGHRVVGDHIGALADGDIVLIGANLPHIWHQEPGDPQGVHAIIVRFDQSAIGDTLMGKPEMEPVVRLLRRAGRGLQLNGRTRTEVEERMIALASAHGLTRFVGLLGILDVLSRSKDLHPLASPGYEPPLKSDDLDRMQRVCEYIHRRITEDIDRATLAKLAHLSEGAFSRFFKSRLGKTVPEYVNEVRIGRACRLMAEDERLNITTIALDCGYRNLANFNRRFRDVMKLSPRDYRSQLRRITA
jgi:AraC-like DNA-binding protein